MASDRVWRDKNEKIVILDSSAIMMPFEFSIDLEQELTRLLGKYRILIPLPVLKELTLLAQQGKETKKIRAKAALKLIADYERIDCIERNADAAVFVLAKKLKAFVVTNDTVLRRKLMDNGLAVIYLRGKQQLAIS